MDPFENQNKPKFKFNVEMNDGSQEKENSQKDVPMNLTTGNTLI